MDEEKVECTHNECYVVPKKDGYITYCVACDAKVEEKELLINE